MLYPHFQKTLVPGWLDKALRHRHRASERLANVVLLRQPSGWRRCRAARFPTAATSRPSATTTTRVVAWRRATGESVRLAEEFEALTRQSSIEALPLP